jgi:hypothetical protein
MEGLSMQLVPRKPVETAPSRVWPLAKLPVFLDLAGKRAVVEYDVKIKRPDLPEQKLTLIGKLRARRSGNEAFRQLETIWNAGFEAQYRPTTGICSAAARWAMKWPVQFIMATDELGAISSTL